MTTLVSLITGELNIMVISARIPEVITFLLKNSSSYALRDDSNLVFLLCSSINCSCIFVISTWVVEIDLDAFFLKASEFFNRTSSFLTYKARYSNVIIGDSEDSKWISFLAYSITLVTIFLIEEQSTFISFMEWRIFSTSPTKLGI